MPTLDQSAHRSTARINLIQGLIIVAWSAAVLVTAGYLEGQIRSHQQQIALVQARSLFQAVVDTRAWNAGHGGVYVEITPGTRPNPYLDVPDRDLETRDGRRLTLVNPAYMTRQVAEIGWQREGIGTHITSLTPIRPANAPDPWERNALERFEDGLREFWEFIPAPPDPPVFRYMAPLVTTASCLPCHRKQGYEKGDIRGGISVAIPSRALIHASRHDLFVQRAGLTLTWLLGVGIVLAIGRTFKEKQRHLQDVEQLSLTDQLTGLLNRRGFFTLAGQHRALAERQSEPFALLYLDLDRFKSINDTYGHHEGDQALVAMAETLRSCFRKADLVARFGGDEFVVLLTDSDLEDGTAARRNLESLLAQKNRSRGKGYDLRLSAGLAAFDPEAPLALEELVLKADRRMYDEKQGRRDTGIPTQRS